MTKKIQPVSLTGGPSAGRQFRPETKWPLYLDAEGKRMKANLGDRIVNGRSATKGCYVLQRDLQARATGYTWTWALGVDPLEQAPAPEPEDTHSVQATSEAYWTKGCGADQLAWQAQQPWSSHYQGEAQS